MAGRVQRRLDGMLYVGLTEKYQQSASSFVCVPTSVSSIESVSMRFWPADPV